MHLENFVKDKWINCSLSIPYQCYLERFEIKGIKNKVHTAIQNEPVQSLELWLNEGKPWQQYTLLIF